MYKMAKANIPRIFILVLLLASGSACNPNRIYEEYNRDFSTLQWEKNKKIEFTPEIKETQGPYKFSLAFRHVYGFQFKDMSVRVTETTPSGKITYKEYTFPVMNKDSEYLGDCLSDICDLESTIEKSKSLSETGKYTYTVEHTMPMDVLSNVMEVGFIIEKISDTH